MAKTSGVVEVSTLHRTEVFVSHRNARLTVFGRRLLVDRIRSGRPVAHVAAETGVSRTTAHKWVRRFAAEGEAALLAGAGHRVTGVDLSPRMVERARAKLKAAGLDGHFLVGDAAAPPTGDARFDVVLCRHLLWTLPDPGAALRQWIRRLRRGGTLVLVEGRWAQADRCGVPYGSGAEALPWGGGVGAEELAGVLDPLVTQVRVEPLGEDAALWGGTVTDERYALLARL